MDEPNQMPTEPEAARIKEPASQTPVATFHWYEPPRLGIIHLLAWTVVTCVLFKIETAMPLGGNGSRVDSMRLVERGVWLLWYTLMAAGIVGTTVIVRGISCRQPGRRAPGHWIIVGQTGAQLVELATNIANYALGASRFIETHPHYSWCFALINLTVQSFIAGYYFAAGIRFRKTTRWAICFLSLAFAGFVQTILTLATIFPFGSPTSTATNLWLLVILPLILMLVAAVVVGIVALIDFRRVRRDWVHFLGIGLYLTQALTTVVYSSLLWYHLFNGFNFRYG